MLARIPVFEGVIVDQRNAVIVLSGAFGGPLSAFLSAVIAGFYRAYLGGGGVFAGVVGLNLAAAAGALLFLWKGSFSGISKAAYRSLIAVIIVLPGFLLVGDLKTGWNLMVDMSIPYGTAIFVGIFLGGLLLHREENRTRVERLLAVSEEKYRVLFESFPLGIFITDKKGQIIETNNLAEDQFAIGFDSERAKLSGGKAVNSAGELIPPSDFPEVLALNENRKISNYEIGIIKPEGKDCWYDVTAAPIPLKEHGVAVVYNDISERKEFESVLKKALDEKTVLLQELYHRTKNNMQMIIALMDTQAGNIDDPRLYSAIADTQHRIHSMSLVHEKLYQSGDLAHINLSEYIQDLVEWLSDSFRVDNNRVAVHYEMKDISISIETAVPCGLVLQEIISNVYKHAFPDDRQGNMYIKVNRLEDESINLVIADDGAGLPPSVDIRENGKLGLSTVITLAEHQLGGRVQFDTAKGLKVSINFKDYARSGSS